MKKYYIYLIISLFSVTGFAQVSVKDSSIHFPIISVSYAYQIPSGDLVNRFGNNSNLGISLVYKTKKNFMFGIEGDFIFGSTIKEPLLFKNLLTSQATVTDQEGLGADLRVFERGYTAFIKAGKVFRYFNVNPNSGILVEGKFGFLQHKIRIENHGNAVPQIEGDYIKGYDRLSNGFAASGFIGYLYLSNKRLLNFFGGFEYIQGWTAGKRYNFSEMQMDQAHRNDILYGLRLGWVIPLYKKVPNEFYYY